MALAVAHRVDGERRVLPLGVVEEAIARDRDTPATRRAARRERRVADRAALARHAPVLAAAHRAR
eukprot:547069-Prymnesium_polylepis.1